MQSLLSWLPSIAFASPQVELIFVSSQHMEIADRLNAVGRDISILIQPMDLVKQLKKGLKSIKGYKDYIVMWYSPSLLVDPYQSTIFVSYVYSL